MLHAWTRAIFVIARVLHLVLLRLRWTFDMLDTPALAPL